MPNIDALLKRSPALKAHVLNARKLAVKRHFEEARREYRAAVKQAEEEFSSTSADYGLILLELADFYESCGRDVELAGIRCKLRIILKHYSASFITEEDMAD